MFTWWKQRKNASSARTSRYRPVLENLERRETPTAAVNVGATINISQAIGNQKDQSVVINPINPNQVASFANIEDITGDGAGDPGLFEAWSTDGGQTWNSQYLFTDTTSLDEANSAPHAAWDRFGNLFVAYTTRLGDVAVAHSLDGGQTFFSQVLTADGLHTAGQVSIAVGPALRPNLSSVWIAYRVNANPAGFVIAPHIETVHAFTVGLGLISPFSGIPDIVPGSDAANGGPNAITVGPRGRVMVSYESTGGPPAGPSQLWSNVDPDGLGSAPWGLRRLITGSNVGFDRVIPANGATSHIDAAPGLAWDNSTGRHRGRVYFTYVDAPTTASNDTNIFLRYSDDNGVTWSAPQRINNDGGAGSQFLPAVAVDQSTGIVAVAWYDARNSAQNTVTQVFAAVSADGGVTFGNNFMVSPDQINAGLSAPPATTDVSSGVGFFSQISFVQGNLQINWSDNSNTLPGNPDPLHMDTATARVRVAPILRVKVIFPSRWRLIDRVNSIYFGRLTIINNSGFDLRGPFTLTMTLPNASLRFLVPANTQVGTTVTFTITNNLRNRVPLRVVALLSNPLHFKLPSSLIGFATTLA